MNRDHAQTLVVQQAALMPTDLLETVGRENENLRNRCEEVVRKVEEAATLRQDLSVVFGHVDTILKDLERTKTALAQRTAALTSEREANTEIKARHRQLLGDHDQLREENVGLLGERQKHFDTAAELEGRVNSLQEGLNEKSKHFTDLTRRADGERERLSQIELDLQAAREEMQRADDLIFSLQSDLSAARDHGTLVEEDNKTLQASLADARAQVARFARKENEVQAILAANKQRIDDLEMMVNSERVEHGKTRALWQGESTSRRGDVASLQARLDAMSSRAEASDRLLAEARSQMHGKIEELRKAERRVQELQNSAAPIEAKLQTLDQENKGLMSRVAELEGAHHEVTQHAEGLLKSVRAKDKDAASWKQKVEALTDRFHVEMNRYEEERERYQQTIARLTEQLEKEKLDRAMAEGALEVSRKQRLAQTPVNGSTATPKREAAPHHSAAAANAAESASHRGAAQGEGNDATHGFIPVRKIA